jgi:hypothetical protein
MKKISTLSFVTLFCLAFNNVNSQVSIGANLGVFKTLVENSDAQYGINLSGKFAINEKIRVGANLGYYFRSYDLLGSTMRSFTMPITGLFEYSFNDNDFSPYAGADIGLYRLGVSGGGESSALGYLGLAPVVGFNYAISDKLLINANLKYHFILTEVESTTAVGLNAGLTFKL